MAYKCKQPTHLITTVVSTVQGGGGCASRVRECEREGRREEQREPLYIIFSALQSLQQLFTQLYKPHIMSW